MITSPEIIEDQNGADYFLVSRLLCRNLAHQQRGKLRLLLVGLWIVIVGMTVAFFAVYRPLAFVVDYYEDSLGELHLLLAFSFLTGMGWSIYLWIYQKIIYKNLLQNSMVLKPYTVTLDESGALFKQANSQTFCSWLDVLAVEEKANYLLMYNGDGMASYLPLRFFENESAKEHFVAAAKNLWQSAQPIKIKG